MEIKYFPRQEWVEVEQASHDEVFNSAYQLPLNCQYKYSVACLDDDGSIIGYALVADSITGFYLEYGGATNKYKNSMKVLPALKMILEAMTCLEVPFITTHVSNLNLRMLKLYLKLGFLITGTSMWKGTIMLELTLDNTKGEM